MESVEFIRITKEQIGELSFKSNAAKRDRQELYRDMATFEMNFAK